jgi:hypothetical protein
VANPLTQELTRCRVCGCTDSDPCRLGCFWVEPDLCSVCSATVANMIENLCDWVTVAHTPDPTRLAKEVERQLAPHLDQLQQALTEQPLIVLAGEEL